MARRKYESESAEATEPVGMATMDANPATFVAETPIATDATPVALSPEQPAIVPDAIPERIRVKLEARRIKAEAKAARDAYAGPLTCVLVKSRAVNGKAIKTDPNKPTIVAEVALQGVTLAEFEALLYSKALRFTPKG